MRTSMQGAKACTRQKPMDLQTNLPQRILSTSHCTLAVRVDLSAVEMVQVEIYSFLVGVRVVRHNMLSVPASGREGRGVPATEHAQKQTCIRVLTAGRCSAMIDYLWCDGAAIAPRTRSQAGRIAALQTTP